jgi:hypothetical protein
MNTPSRVENQLLPKSIPDVADHPTKTEPEALTLTYGKTEEASVDYKPVSAKQSRDIEADNIPLVIRETREVSQKTTPLVTIKPTGNEDDSTASLNSEDEASEKEGHCLEIENRGNP